MKIKTIPEDFIVNEIFDLESLKNKDEGKGEIYFYFKLTKKDYNQIKALETIARIFNTSKKLIHFAGTKDKVGITSQIISIRGINETNLENNLKFFNDKINDMNLEFLGKYKSRINLGDNLGNNFEITIRDLEKTDINIASENLTGISKNGVLNYFDEQRFGYANNSHIIGKYILKNELKNAVYEILTSSPPSPSEDLQNFINYIKNNFEQIANQDIETINNAINITPDFLRNEKLILEHLKKYKNDFPGAFRKIHKKLRTMYLNAYQSYLFNECINTLEEENKLNNYTQLPLITYDSQLSEEIKKIIDKLLKTDNLTLENFKLPSSPELLAPSIMRDVKIKVHNLKIDKIDNDELNKNKKKIKITFNLDKGAYATNVIKQLFTPNS